MKKRIICLGVLFFLVLTGCAKSKDITKLNQQIMQPQKKESPVATSAQKTQTTTTAALPQDSPGEKVDQKAVAQDKALEAAVKKQPSKEKRIAPDFKLLDIYQDTYAFSDYKGKQPLLLFFWTTWCPFCQNELRQLHNRYPTLVNNGLEVLAIDVGEQTSQVDDFIKGSGISPGFKVLVDTDTTVSNSYQVVGVPTYILVSTEGYIIFQDNEFPDNYSDLIKEAQAN